MSNTRDYDRELQDTAQHQYAYNFDLSVMHPLMIRSFEPFFVKGSLLELGSFKGDFTQRLLAQFDDVTCVEASNLAIEEAKQRLASRVTFVHSTFESAKLNRLYDNVVLTHVLEHLDDPIGVLRRVKQRLNYVLGTEFRNASTLPGALASVCCSGSTSQYWAFGRHSSR